MDNIVRMELSAGSKSADASSTGLHIAEAKALNDDLPRVDPDGREIPMAKDGPVLPGHVQRIWERQAAAPGQAAFF
ncbi:MAG: hypothetical protein AAF409_08565 [Pseudomonadota bacterium]